MLVGSGLTGMGLPWAIHIAMWVLAAGSIVTVFQRVLAVRNSLGARELLPIAPAASTVEGTPNTDGEPKTDGEAEK